MNIQLKQRLVGAVVLVSLAVIFIPMILPGGGELSGSIDGSNVPQPPDYRFPAPRPAPEAPAMAAAPPVPLKGEPSLAQSATGGSPAKAAEAPKKTSQAAPAKGADRDTAKPPTKPATKSSPKPPVKTPAKAATSDKGVQRWVVQVGSFAKQRNAQQLRDRLRKQGYASFMERVDGKLRTTYRVRVGPELTRARALKLKKQLASKQKLKDMMVQRYP